MKEEYKGWLVASLFAVCLIIVQVTNYLDNKNKYKIIKTNIGEFVLKDGKIYSVYEMQRNVAGDMVAR